MWRDALLLLALGLSANVGWAANTDTLECAKCHTCEHPRPDQPCLRACPRHDAAAALKPALGPDVVVVTGGLVGQIHVLDGATGRSLVPVLGSTGQAQLVFGAGLAVGLALG